MREILFRGKKDNGEWEYGVPVFSGLNNELAFMKQMHSYDHQVIPETVGQYTGLTDKKGIKIFEGDIVKATIAHNNFSRDKVDYRTNIYEVKYHEKHCYFYLARKNNNLLFDGNWSYGLKTIEVIDNIHDNPELLRSENNAVT